jgi:2-phosphosulfolactate phosphatase
MAKKCGGFDYGNSPSIILKKNVTGKTIRHTTGAGTQGIVMLPMRAK